LPVPNFEGGVLKNERSECILKLLSWVFMVKKKGNNFRILWIALLDVFLIASVFYLITGRVIRSSIETNVFDQELTIARAEASNIKSFVKAVGNSITIIAQSNDIKVGSNLSERVLDDYVSNWRAGGVIAGVVLVDSKGVVRNNSNILGTHSIGTSVADRDYFIWAKSQDRSGNYFVGNPVISRLGASKDQTIVPIASPIFMNGTFQGVVTTSVLLRPLTQEYLNMMKIDNSTNVYLIDENGRVLYENGGPALDEELVKSLNMRVAGRLKSEGRYIAYVPVTLSAQNWLLIVNTSNQKILIHTATFHLRQFLVLLLISCISVGSIIFVHNKSIKA